MEQPGRLLAAVVIFCCLAGTIKAVLPDYEVEEPLLYDTFPESFLWGTATAAYQVCNFCNKKKRRSQIQFKTRVLKYYLVIYLKHYPRYKAT